MKKHLRNLKKNQPKVKKPIIVGVLDNNKTFLHTPPWLEGWEADDDESTGLFTYVAKKLKGKIDEFIENKTGR